MEVLIAQNLFCAIRSRYLIHELRSENASLQLSMMFCIITELKGIEIKLVFGSVFRPQISRVLDMGLKGGKTWTRFPNIQIYSNRETEAFISCQQVHTAERGVQFRICHKFIEIFILL